MCYKHVSSFGLSIIEQLVQCNIPTISKIFAVTIIEALAIVHSQTVSTAKPNILQHCSN